VLLSRDGKLLNRLALTAPVADVAYDAARNQIVAVTARSDTLQVFDSALMQPAVSVALPWTPCDGDKTSIQYDPVSGEFLLHCDGSPTLTRVSLSNGRVVETRSVSLDGARSPLGLTIGDHGQILVSDGGQIVEFSGEGRRIEGSAFAGLPGGSRLEIRRSFGNLDPRLDDDPRFRNGRSAQ
jgi:hypothetical protein